MDFAKTKQACTWSCIECDTIFKAIVPSHDIDICEYMSMQLNVDIDTAYALYHNQVYAQIPDGHYLLGYPYFTQEDPRYYANSNSLDTALLTREHIHLLQIDTQEDLGIYWGDCGIMHLFIHPKDIKNQNWHKVIYYWDCH